jgi:cytoskeletal protein CcmA (bactofilin family)
MDWPWQNAQRQSSEEWAGFLDDRVRIEGKLESKGTLRINSAVKGSLVCEATLIIGAQATVEGQLTGKQIVIAGRVDGIIHAESRVEIQMNAIVSGEIYSPCLVVAPGALFDGQFHMVREGQTDETVAVPIRSQEGRS